MRGALAVAGQLGGSIAIFMVHGYLLDLVAPIA